jgi:hypothetical protein
MLRHKDPMRGGTILPFLPEWVVEYNPKSAGGG